MGMGLQDEKYLVHTLNHNEGCDTSCHNRRLPTGMKVATFVGDEKQL